MITGPESWILLPTKVRLNDGNEPFFVGVVDQVEIGPLVHRAGIESNSIADCYIEVAHYWNVR